MSFQAFDNFVSELTESITASDTYLPLPLTDSLELCSGTGCNCDEEPAPIEAVYTRLQISDGVNFEIVKVVGCEGSTPIMERGQDGTMPRNFPAGSCVRFTWIQSNLDDFICEADCAGGSGGCSCILQSNTISIAFGPEEDTYHIEIPNSYINPGAINGVQVVGNMYELDIDGLIAGTVAGTHKIAIFDGSQHVSLTLDDICGFCATASGGDDEHTVVVAGTGIGVIRTDNEYRVQINDTGVAAGDYEGAQVNAQGQFVEIPVGWPHVSEVAAAILIVESRLDDVEGLAKDIEGGVDITVDKAGPINIVNHNVSPVLPGTHLGITVDAQGHVQNMDGAYVPVDTVSGIPPIIVDDDGLGGIVISYDDTVSGEIPARTSHWVGSSAGVVVYAKGGILGAAGAVAEEVVFVFSVPRTNSAYTVSCVDNNGTPIPIVVTARSLTSFTATFATPAGEAHVVVVD